MRIASIDAFRTVAVLAVICIHTGPFMGGVYGPSGDLLGCLINQTAHLAIPFFFLAAGYFMARKVAAGEHPLRAAYDQSWRLLTVFVFWSLVYLAVPADLAALRQPDYLQTTCEKIAVLMDDPGMMLFFDGARSHLWFITALLLAVWQVAVFVYSGHGDRLPYWALILYVVGLLGGSYSTTPFGLDLHFNTRNGPFFSTLLVTVGWCLANPRIKVPLRWAAVTALLGFLLCLAEALVLWQVFGVPLYRHDYLWATVPCAAGLFLMLLARPALGKNTMLPRLAKYTLGIYVCHVLLVDKLYMLRPSPAVLAFELGFPVFIFLVSLALVYAMSRVPILRPLVMTSSARSESQLTRLFRRLKSQQETHADAATEAVYPLPAGRGPVGRRRSA